MEKNDTKWTMKNFTMKEVECPCCNVSGMARHTIEMFQEARNLLGTPVYITSGCRCWEHNNDLKRRGYQTSNGSSHIFTDERASTACDVALIPRGSRPMTSLERFKLLQALLAVGFTRIGIGKSFIHADDDPRKPGSVIWTY